MEDVDGWMGRRPWQLSRLQAAPTGRALICRGRWVGCAWRWRPVYRPTATRAFTSGLHAPPKRVRESEWRALLARLADSIFCCGHCGAENFYDGATLRANGGAPGPCWACHRPLTLPVRLRLGSGAGADMVMLNHDTRLYPHHLDPDRRYDYSESLAQVQRHPSDPHRWGLQNLGAEKWVLTGADGTLRDIEPGRSAGLNPGVRVQFGKRDGEIGG